MFNLSHGLKDPKYWKYPDRFYPEHFLTEEGKPYKPENFMPFGSGKRQMGTVTMITIVIVEVVMIRVRVMIMIDFGKFHKSFSSWILFILFFI